MEVPEEADGIQLVGRNPATTLHEVQELAE